MLRISIALAALLLLVGASYAIEISNNLTGAGGLRYDDNVGGAGIFSVSNANNPTPVAQGDFGFAIGQPGAYSSPASNNLNGLTAFPMNAPNSIAVNSKYGFTHTYVRVGASDISITGTCETQRSGTEVVCDLDFDSGVDAFGNLQFVFYGDVDASSTSGNDYFVVSGTGDDLIVKVVDAVEPIGAAMTADYASATGMSFIGFAAAEFPDFTNIFSTVASGSNVDTDLFPAVPITGLADDGFGPADIVGSLGWQFNSADRTASLTYRFSGVHDFDRTNCGNAEFNQNEVCDGVNLNGVTCDVIVGSGSDGSIQCNPSCDGFITDGCGLASSATSTPSPSRTRSASQGATPSPTRSAFATPTPTASFTPSIAPSDIIQPAGASTANVIIELDVAFQGRSVESNPLANELVVVISSYMNIDANDVVVVKVSVNEEASVIICAGDIDGFINDLNDNVAFFDNTILDGAYVETAFFGVPCEDPLSDLPSNSYWGGDDDDVSGGITTDVTTFGVFSTKNQIYTSRYSPGGRYISQSSTAAALAMPTLLVCALASAAVAMLYL